MKNNNKAQKSRTNKEKKEAANDKRTSAMSDAINYKRDSNPKQNGEDF